MARALIGGGLWAIFAFFFWAIVHVGSRNDRDV